jgi:hypothetical protein
MALEAASKTFNLMDNLFHYLFEQQREIQIDLLTWAVKQIISQLNNNNMKLLCAINIPHTSRSRFRSDTYILSCFKGTTSCPISFSKMAAVQFQYQWIKETHNNQMAPKPSIKFLQICMYLFLHRSSHDHDGSIQ